MLIDTEFFPQEVDDEITGLFQVFKNQEYHLEVRFGAGEIDMTEYCHGLEKAEDVFRTKVAELFAKGK